VGFHGRDAFAERGISEAKTGSGRPVGAARSPRQASGVEKAKMLAYVSYFFIPGSDQIKHLALLTAALS
jgi:hypothetical protein